MQSIQRSRYSQAKALPARHVRRTVSEHTQAHLRPGLTNALFPVGERTGACVVLFGEPLAVARERVVHALSVVVHRAAHVEARHCRRHRTLASADPLRRKTIGVPRVVERERFLLERVVDQLGFERVTTFRVLDVHGRNAPAVVLRPPFCPPAVEHAQVEHAIDRGLHTRRATRLERRDGIVEPHVDARDEPA